jgi:hypothetical protein
MTSNSLMRPIGAFSKVARPIMLEYFPRNNCISGTRMAIECLAHFGIDIRPKAVMLCVKIPDRNLLFCAGLTEEEKAAGKAVAANWVDTTTNGYDGHVIGVVEDGDDRILIDCSLDQAFAELGVPEELDDIFVMRMPAPVPDDFLLELDMLMSTGGKAQIQYGCRPGPTNFEEQPAWETDHLQLPIRRIVAAMKAHHGLP